MPGALPRLDELFALPDQGAGAGLFSPASPLELPDRPVRLEVDSQDPYVAQLHVVCRDHVGVLFRLCELLSEHSVDILGCEVSTENNIGFSCLQLRTARAKLFADAPKWCQELECFVASRNCDSSAHFSEQLKASLAAVSKRLSVNPDLISVVSFSEVVASDPLKLNYHLELSGINQAGLLCYTCLVLVRSGFSIDEAHVSTVDGLVKDTFDLTTSCPDAENKLRSYLHMPTTFHTHNVSDTPLPFHATPRDSVEGSRIRASPHSEIGPPLSMEADFGSPPPSESNRGDVAFGPCPTTLLHTDAKDRVVFPNGDVYAGDCLGHDGAETRHGYGTYFYSSSHETYKQYTGQWNEDKKHGYGVLLYRHGGVYVGQWERNQKHGLGVLLDSGGDGQMPSYRYEGQWLEDVPNGLGVEESEASYVFGLFANGNHGGRGVRMSLNGRVSIAGCEAFEGNGTRPLLEALEAEMATFHQSSASTCRVNLKSPLMSPLMKPSGSPEESPTGRLEASFGTFSSGLPHELLFGGEADSGSLHLDAESLGDYQRSLAPEAQTMPARRVQSRPALTTLAWGADASTGSTTKPLGPSAKDKSVTFPALEEQGKSVLTTDQKKCESPTKRTRWQTDSDTFKVLEIEDCATVKIAEDLRRSPMSEQDTTPSQPGERPDIGSLGGLFRKDSGSMANPQDVLSSPAEPSSSSGDSGLKVKRRVLFSDKPMPCLPSNGSINYGDDFLMDPEEAQRNLEANAMTVPARGKSALRYGTAPVRRSVRSSPLLWCQDELAAFMGCLGISREVCLKVQKQKLKGVAHLLDMANWQMRDQLGLEAPIERLVVRQALKRLLDIDRWENNIHCQRGGDLLADTVLSRHMINSEELRLLGKISQGGYGTVYRGVLEPRNSKRKQQEVAVKEMKGERRVRLHELLKEACVMASLNHANICTFIGVCTDVTGRKHYIVSELMDCSLFDLAHYQHKLQWHGDLSIARVVKLSQGICAGIVYLHGRMLVHADLKSSNILIDYSSESQLLPRICDFGHAAVRTHPAPHHRCGTPHWTAPEVLRSEALGPAADVYSFGVILWEMLTRKLPHKGLSFGQVLASVGWAGWTPDLEAVPEVPLEIRRLLQACLRFTPADRPTSHDAGRRLRRVPRQARMKALAMLSDFFGRPLCFPCACTS